MIERGSSRKRSLSYAAWVAALTLALSCGSGRDFVPETHDVRGAANAARDTTGYEYVAKRPMGAVALAEARGLDAASTARIVDRLADALEACAEDLARGGKLVDGAARIAAEVSPGGSPGGLALKVEPGGAVMANALLCFITPFKLTSFAPAAPDAGPRGLAVEATWGPRIQSTGSSSMPDGGLE